MVSALAFALARFQNSRPLCRHLTAGRLTMGELPTRWEHFSDAIGDIGDSYIDDLDQRVDVHDYVSTACQHDLHDQCRQTCKFCTKPCRCACHTGTERAKTSKVPR